MKSEFRLYAIELRNGGASYRQIAEILGLSVPNVAKFFGQAAAWKEAAPCEAQLLRAKLLRGLGVPHTAIAARTGLTYAQTLTACDGVAVVGRYVPPIVPPAPRIDLEIARLKREGYTDSAIAAHLGVKMWKVRKYGKGAKPVPPPLPPAHGKLTAP